MKIETYDDGSYKITFTKIIQDIDGIDVEVVDHYEEGTIQVLVENKVINEQAIIDSRLEFEYKEKVLIEENVRIDNLIQEIGKIEPIIKVVEIV